VIRLAEMLSPPSAKWPDDPDRQPSTTHDLYPEQGAPLVGSLYPGFAVAVLAAVGFATRFRLHYLEASLVALGAALAIGSKSIIWIFVNAVPVLNIGRFPEKWSLLIVVGCVLAACRTLQRLCTAEKSDRRHLGWAVLIAAAVLAFVRIGVESAAVSGGGRGATFESLLVITVGFGSGFALWVAATSQHAAVRGLATVIALLMLVAELQQTGGHLVPSRKPQDDLQPPRFLSPIAGRSDAARLFHLASLRSTPRALLWMAPPPTPALWGIRTILERDFDSTQLRWTRRAQEANLELMAAYPGLTRRQLARVGVGSVAELVDRGAQDPTEFAVVLSPVPQPAALVSCVEELVRVDSWDEWVEAAAATMVRSDGEFAVILRSVAGLPDSPGECSLEITSSSPDRLDLHVNVAGPDSAVLQVNQTWDPGWRATIDGSTAPIARSDIAFAALVVPEGLHVVTLKYRDRYVSLGLTISALSLFVLGLWASVLSRQRQVRGSGPRRGRRRCPQS